MILLIFHQLAGVLGEDLFTAVIKRLKHSDKGLHKVSRGARQTERETETETEREVQPSSSSSSFLMKMEGAERHERWRN